MHACLGARFLDAIRIALLIAKLQRIGRDIRRRHRFELPAVEKRLQPRVGAHPHVVAGARNDELISLEVFVEDHLSGLRALYPKIAGHLPLLPQAADLWPNNAIDPVHFAYAFFASEKAVCLTRPHACGELFDEPQNRPYG